MSTRTISWGWKQPMHRADSLTIWCLEIWETQPPGTLRSCPDQYRDSFTFTLNMLLQVVCVVTHSLHMLHAFTCCMFSGNRALLKLGTLLW